MRWKLWVINIRRWNVLYWLNSNQSEEVHYQRRNTSKAAIRIPRTATNINRETATDFISKATRRRTIKIRSRTADVRNE